MRTHNLRVFFGSHLHYHTQSGSGSGSGKGGSKSGKSSKGSGSGKGGSGKGGSGKGGSKSSKSSGKVRVIYVASVDDDPTLLSSSIYIRKSNPNPIHVQYSIVSFLHEEELLLVNHSVAFKPRVKRTCTHIYVCCACCFSASLLSLAPLRTRNMFLPRAV